MLKKSNKIISKPFLYTLFIGQNKWHKHSVLGHTLKVLYGCFKFKRYDFIIVAILHDIGKPFVAYQDKDDLKKDYISYSFTNHEEKSYQIIKNWKLSKKTKLLVRYHYLLRSIEKLKNKGKFKESLKKENIYNSLTSQMKLDLKEFQKIDDYGKL